ncbi:hypothetical protein CEXT_17111 [Caerostris extrusa]|uniref:Uncharacterized protein n=1 Tax=Caerostris extrusa TaxID=172846 RepID=A0AAV4S3E4_CAEEX|nr:hypothetical protein CEXT_17111 [Caerostris extrusa]
MILLELKKHLQKLQSDRNAVCAICCPDLEALPALCHVTVRVTGALNGPLLEDESKRKILRIPSIPALVFPEEFC